MVSGVGLLGLGFNGYGLGLKVDRLLFRIERVGFWADAGFGFRVQGSGFRI